QSFVIKVNNLVLPEGAQIYLHDRLLGSYLQLTDGTEYPFEITKDKATQGTNRFELTMKPAPEAQQLAFGVALSPNPASAEAVLTFSGVTDEVKVTVTDINGIALFRKTFTAQQATALKVPMSKLAAGVYMVEVNSGNNKVVKRLVKE
ncbi:MAG: T9SS C-terminal target domain-containing protein, partial [Chitinophagia bacterium]|nr:T9SS C-terminal target domain-containing protein [Chitinophagia bacterium]